MNLYLISQTVNTDYDTYDSAVVAAMSEDEARSIHPYNFSNGRYEKYNWCAKEDVRVKLIGTSINDVSGVICASYNAG